MFPLTISGNVPKTSRQSLVPTYETAISPVTSLRYATASKPDFAFTLSSGLPSLVCSNFQPAGTGPGLLPPYEVEASTEVS